MSNDNKVDEKLLYNENSLTLLNIKELRDVGRKFGVPSPTTKSKKELIDYILKILYGEIKAPVRSVYGRPSVREFDMGKYLKKIEKNSVLRPESLKLVLNSAGFEAKLSSGYEEYELSDEIEQKVFVDCDEGLFLRSHAFVESENDIKVSKDFALKYKLENFDMVEIASNKENIKIISINGEKVETGLDFLIVKHSKAKGGASHIFHFDTKEEIKEEIVSISNQCKQKNAELFVFSPNKLDIEANITSFEANEGGSSVYKKLMYFVALCEKCSMEEKSLVLVLDRSDLVVDMLNTLEEDVSARIKKHFQDAVEKIVELGNVALLFKLEKVVIY